ncbi:MAG TPA: D-alanyl-D-alanine carboxypeptidase/D-alanyl-D-alanine-endopeptidase [Polyangia bacterium]|nr:D-alanyl-D-alanine carboxypeptidase/D-alanyl-D-alanine-endopeptidase [Polyangia bacterium]
MTAPAALVALLWLAAPREGVAAPSMHAGSRGRAWSRTAASLPLRSQGRLTGGGGEEAPPPAADDRDRERILRLQTSLRDIVHAAFGRLKVGLRVVEAHSGRVFFGRGTTALMDPASNQKVLATTTALVRLGSSWRFRTEVYGAPPDDDGVVEGDIFLRGSGDPTLGPRELEELASRLSARGVRRITGGIVADPRRIGDDGPVSGDDKLPQLSINRGLVSVRVQAAEAGESPSVVLDPGPPPDQNGATSDFIVVNQARSYEGRQRRLAVDVNTARGTLRVEVAGRIGTDSPGVLYRRRVPDGPMITAIFFRAALASVGIAVRERATVGAMHPNAELLVTHSSAPLGVLLRRINKDSDNYEAERLLEAVGAEVLGGAATTDKGIAVLRDVISEFGLDPHSYLSKNGSGLGHANRISARSMTELLRALYMDPRVGPELLQSLSVGGVDGTTRNRFRGLPVARHVRAKTGTLVGKSCLSGLVGDGSDVMAFSIMVQGFKSRRALSAVRGAQVAAVNMMMRYVQERDGVRVDAPATFDEPAGVDYETGGEIESEDEVPEGAPGVIPARLAVEDERAGHVAAAHKLARAPEAAIKNPQEPPAAKPAEPPASAADPPERESDLARLLAGPTSVRLGVGGAGAIAGADAVPGARVFVDFGPPLLGIEAAFYGTTFHALQGPGAGRTEWTRMVGAVGPRYHLRARAVSLDLNAALAAGWFWVHGHGYSEDISSRSWAFGAGLGARLSLERTKVAPWIGFDAMAWPGSHSIAVMDVSESKDIPAVDLLMSLGFSLKLF